MSLKIALWGFRFHVPVLLDHPNGQGGLVINGLPADPSFHIPHVPHLAVQQ